MNKDSKATLKWWHFKTIYKRFVAIYKEDKRLRRILNEQGLEAYLKATKND